MNDRTVHRRAALLATAALAVAPRAARAAWPERPVRWIVGYPAGGGTDVLARLVGAAMSARLGTPVVVENRPGAATNIAAEAAANAPPDGYTVFTAGNETLVFNPALYKRLPFDADNGLRPLGLMARFHLVLCAKREGGAVDAAGFSERARARGGAMDYGSPGIGSPHHLATERLARDLGVRLNHVPYRGMAPVMNDLVAGTVEAAVLDMAAGAEVIRSGRVRPLALLSPARLPAIPDVPTAAEAFNLPGFEAYAWQGLTAPVRTPDDVAARLTAELAAALADPTVQGRMREIGLDPLSGGPEEHQRLIASERAIYWPLIRVLGLSLD
ncbi:tripartite tricarboxylate transporter substrate binding protein [Craurococcus roseus]|uniref:Tripartite tricarboxylate transporter substrate binding protein n=1 Tax=Craurococcus roseus TaxID=77585 RepID=A0ABN1EUZ7_9PROT